MTPYIPTKEEKINYNMIIHRWFIARRLKKQILKQMKKGGVLYFDSIGMIISKDKYDKI